MTTHTGSVAVGAASGALPQLDEVQEYEKILRISDQIFSGAHPRLKVPQQFVRKVTPRNPQTPPVTQPQVTAVEPSKTTTAQSKTELPLPSSTRPANLQATTPLNGSAAASSTTTPSRIVPKPTSEIDPIFLTKSDDLVRAEMQLQRQRVERVLRDQLEQRRVEARKQASFQDGKPDFDVSGVLSKALEIVKPVAAPADVHGTNGQTAPSDSFDENSFYSSRAPDSPQHGEPSQPSPVSDPQSRRVGREELAANAEMDSRSDESRRFEITSPRDVDMIPQVNPYTVADKHFPPQRQLDNAPLRAASDEYDPARGPIDIPEEPEYSPPGPDVPPVVRVDSREYYRPESYARRQVSDSRPSRGYHGRRSISPANGVRIVRNHIISPAAPQPSRVSPLAMAKMPIQQARVPRQDHLQRVPTGYDSARTSPDGGAQQLMPRKRRRVQEPREQMGSAASRRPADVSPVPYIKEEPVSPPPFTDVRPTYSRARQPQEQAYVDLASPRYTPILDRREVPAREPVYEVDRYGRAYEQDSHVEPAIPRTVSRLGSRRPVRDEQDLRRVASLHHVRQPELSRDYVEPVNPRSMRAASYAVVERPQERVRYYDEPVQGYGRRYIPADELPPSPRFREAYPEEEPRILAPPQRRIVVDEYGNQYYETLPLPKIQDMPPPPPPGRIARADAYSEQVPSRRSSVRATSIIDDPYGERRYVQEVHPPAAYRRVTEYPREVVGDRRVYAPQLDEREPVFRSGSVQVVDYPPRRTAYLDERDIPGERIVRMSSVRPPTTRYEDPRDGIPRVQSVRPGGREVSVYIDDEPRKAREYAQAPIYTTMRPMREERYYDDDESGRMIYDGTRDAIHHRGPQRY
ncbi:hypothetical protein Plec18167_002129 [Paecilomyces lecythidis]|uniref:Uncharacterized protein n=1 Tax=Paecilomyces lecythidis TaxID=3004212 RepID=A0ABR3YAR0_9EURO